MSVYTFEAEPRVVRAKSKFRNEEVQSRQTPLEMAEESVKTKMENRRSELRKEQLLLFKKNRQRQNLYELRPAPEPKVEVDLSYFLIEQNIQNAVNDSRCTQTDEWDETIERKVVYAEQKKGVDVETQIWDDDLFDYDVEVEPIINVLVFKTLEQARLEVDEDAEIEAIKIYKEEYRKRKEMEREDWKKQMEEEEERLKQKNEMLKQAREVFNHQETVTKKLQCLHVAKNYLKGILHSSSKSIIEANYWQSEKFNAMHSQFIPIITQKVQGAVKRKEEIKGVIHELLLISLTKPIELLDPIKKQRENMIKMTEQLRRMQDSRYRRVSILFNNLIRPKPSRLGLCIRKTLEGKLEEWENDMKDTYNKYKERYLQQEEHIDDLISQYNEQVWPPCREYMIEIDNFPMIAFTAASDPYDYLADNYKRYWPEVYLYSEDGSFLGKSGTAMDMKFESFLRGSLPKREKSLKENDDAKINIALPSVPEEIASIILTIREDPINKKAKDNWYNNARYRLIDENTCQNIEYEKLIPILEKVPNNPEEPAEMRTIVCGRIYRNTSTMKWIYESYKGVVIGKMKEVERKIAGFGELVNRERLPTIDIGQWDDEYLQRRMQASKGKKGKKEDKSNKSQSKTDDKKKGKLKKESEAAKVLEEEIEETLDKKLAGYLDFPIGPIEIDCEKDKSIIEVEIIEAFKNANPVLFEKCENGVEIFVKDRLFTNPKQILRYSHILKLFIIRPKVPQIVAEVELVENPETDEQPNE